MLPPRPTELAHQILRNAIPEGALVVDATCGNGHDTLFLAGLVGPTGKVLAFDVQETAIASARKRLTENGLQDRVEWHCESHSRISEHAAAGSVSAVMFNLGYLPGQDHRITTLADETLIGLAAAENALGENGLLSVVSYPGHDEGAVESKAVSGWMEALASRGWSLAKYGMIGTRRPAPFLLLAARCRSSNHF
jgi:tRNA1(Val) A37 N6-methylase TrmN6